MTMHYTAGGVKHVELFNVYLLRYQTPTMIDRRLLSSVYMSTAPVPDPIKHMIFCFY